MFDILVEGYICATPSGCMSSNSIHDERGKVLQFTFIACHPPKIGTCVILVMVDVYQLHKPSTR